MEEEIDLDEILKEIEGELNEEEQLLKKIARRRRI